MDECTLQDVREQPLTATVAVPGGSTLQALYDQLEIHQLIADRAYTYDEQDAEGFGVLFVPDGCVELFYPGEATPAVRFETEGGDRGGVAELLRSGAFQPPHSDPLLERADRSDQPELGESARDLSDHSTDAAARRAGSAHQRSC